MKVAIVTVLLLVCAARCADLNLAPVIGIYAEPSDYKEYPSKKYSYIAASYVKWAEMAGVQVVPIYYDADQAYYDNIFDSINGIIFPGGSVDLSKGEPFADNAQYLLNKAIDANDRGDVFPVWGTCLGWELLATLVSNFADNVLSTIKDESGVTHPIEFVSQAPITDAMPQYLVTVSETQPVWYFNHQYCVVPETVKSIPALNSFFQIVAVARNDLGDEFVALAEAYDYPIYGTQFHPEKNNFEWRVPANHDLNAILSSQYLADYFVQRVRSSQHKFASSSDLQNALIYNFESVVLPPSESSFSEVYIIPNWSGEKARQNPDFLGIRSANEI